MARDKSETLFVFYQDKLVGQLLKLRDGNLSFSYSQSWVEGPGAFDLVPSMPREKGSFGNLQTKAFFENLLPEGHGRDRINQLYKDVTKDSFKFLKLFGQDCAGAFVISTKSTYPSGVDPFEAEEILLEELDKALDEKSDLATYVHQKHKGRFSLAGAQDKIAIIFHEGRLYVPTQGAATTHILKPPIQSFGNGVDTVYNELYCMRLAQALGLEVPHSFVLQGKFPYYLIERYDREISETGQVLRLHQFDICQEHGYLSSDKYEEDGGPELAEVFNLIKNLSDRPTTDLRSMLDWLCFNLLIGNNDSHSKNLSFLRKAEIYRLAPFYDLISTAVYPGINGRFAFGFGKKGQKQYHWHNIRSHHLQNTAKNLGVNKFLVQDALAKIAERLEKVLPQVHTKLAHEEGDKRIFFKLDQLILKRINFYKRHVLLKR
jgi:serine/threonine-protein kinase HipA